MNLLSHYYLDAEKGRPYYNTGLVMPDLMGSFKKGWKPPKSVFFNNNYQKELYSGMLQHQETDRQFHASLFFTHAIPDIRKIFEKNGLKLPGVRLFFVAHIMLELMLDRLILLDSMAYADNFYSDINKVDVEQITEFFQVDTMNGEYNFSGFFQKFRDAKYIYNYVGDENFIYALNRIMKRAAQPVFEGENIVALFKNAIFEVEKYLAPDYLRHFDELKEKSKA